MAIDKKLRDRWTTPEGEALADEVFARLMAGRPLDGLGLDECEGRVDLRGLPAPIPSRLARYEFEGWFVSELGGLLWFRDQTLTRLDLRGAVLDSLRIWYCRFVDCLFDEARCQDWRMWGSTFEGVSFKKADLRSAALGAWHEGRGNTFTSVDFSGSNLRQIVCPAASFADCDFSLAKLVKIDFGTSSFVRCRFAGPLKDVTFWGRRPDVEKPDPNPMLDVDFSDAMFREVQFQLLELAGVTLPAAPELLVIDRYACVVRETVGLLERDEARYGKGLGGWFSVVSRWTLPDQQVGIVNLVDFEGLIDPLVVRELIERAIQACA